MSIRNIKIYTSTSVRNITEIDSILEPARIFARSYGLQPFKIINIEDEAIKAKLLPEKGASKKINEHLHLIVLAIRPVITSEHISDFISDVKASKKITSHSLTHYQKHIEGFINRDTNSKWASKQAYKALDILSASAKEAGAGISFFNDINSKFFNETLDLEKEGLTAYIAVVLNLRAGKKIWASAPEINN